MEERTIAEKINAINLQASTYYDPCIAQELAKARIQCQKEAVKQEIQIAATKKKAETLADVASRKELQKIKLRVCIGQGVKVLKERFGGDDLSDEAEFSVLSCHIVTCMEKMEDKLLHIGIRNKTSREISVFLSFRKLEDKYIAKKFATAGIMFGFSYEKERRVRWMFITELLDMAPVCFLPPAHG